jgi:hypothetical protein
MAPSHIQAKGSDSGERRLLEKAGSKQAVNLGAGLFQLRDDFADCSRPPASSATNNSHANPTFSKA